MRRFFSTSRTHLTKGKKRADEWVLPDLNKLPGGFRGKIYNKRDWTQFINQNTKMKIEEKPLNIKAPPKHWRKKELPEYLKNKYALREKKIKMGFKGQENIKKLSRKTIDGIKLLHDKFPEELTTDKLAQFFRVSPVAISKILKSRWEPSDNELERMDKRWEKHSKQRATNLMMESQFQDFIQSKEAELKMEIPEFFRLELYGFYKHTGIEHLKEEFTELNDARIAKDKQKQEKIINDIDI